MTLILRRYVSFLILLVPALAVPKLRLSTSSIGPITVAAGTNGTAQIVEAGNAGDGTLALTATSSVTWLNASVGAARLCSSRPASCLPVTIGLVTASLAKGKYTGFVTVSDPNAVDAPQTISVTVQVGTGVPDAVELFLPPNGAARTTFTTGSNLITAVTNPPGQTLSVAGQGGGSFAFSFSYQVTATSPAGTVDGDYRGSFTTSRSTFADDNKTVPVTLHVTLQALADYAPASVRFRVAQGAAKVDKWVVFTSRGVAPLALSGATVAATPAAPWLAAKLSGNLVVLTADVTGLAVGTQQASVTVAGNARNGPFTIPVTLEVLATAAPTSFYQGVLDNALFKAGDPVAPGGIVAITGEQFTTGDAAQAAQLPLGTVLGGATVFVNDVAAPVYYVAGSHVVNNGGQINFQMPYNVPPGEALVRVDREGRRGNTVSVPVLAQVPRLLRLGIDDYAIAVVDPGITFPIPPRSGIASRRAKVGDVVTFYALGLGQTTPPVVEGRGAPGAEPLARAPGYQVIFGVGSIPGTGVHADPFFVGLTPGSVGLYQINVFVPEATPRGDAVPVGLVSNQTQSNTVAIAIE